MLVYNLLLMLVYNACHIVGHWWRKHGTWERGCTESYLADTSPQSACKNACRVANSPAQILPVWSEHRDSGQGQTNKQMSERGVVLHNELHPCLALSPIRWSEVKQTVFTRISNCSWMFKEWHEKRRGTSTSSKTSMANIKMWKKLHRGNSIQCGICTTEEAELHTST